MKTFKILTVAATLLYFASSCNTTDRNRKLGGQLIPVALTEVAAPQLKIRPQ